MSLILILLFFGGMTSIFIFLLNYLFNPVITNTLLFNIGVYLGTLAGLALLILIPLLLLHWVYRGLHLDIRWGRDYINDLGNISGVLIVGLTTYLIYKFGFYAPELFSKISGFLGVDNGLLLF